MKKRDKMVQSDLLKQNSGNPDGQSSSPTGGPQFGFKDKGGWGARIKGWINKYGSSIILPIIALLILAGGIYLYASQKSQEEALSPADETATDISQLLEEEEAAEQPEIVSPPAEEAEEPLPIEEIIPEGDKGQITEKAAKGEGVTHLARRALKDYLANHSSELTNEHKIYIEDFLKDEIGSRPLEVDEEITFSEDLIKQAIDASSQLTPEQLKILEKYSALVDWSKY
jgi:hypothetical protein